MAVVSFIIIVLLAAILQTSTGFGFSIMATPFLLLLFEARDAIQINLILSLVISIALMRKLRKHADFGILKRFVIGSLPGLGIGLVIFLFVSEKVLMTGIGLALLMLTFLLMMNIRLQKSERRDFIVGGLSGTLTTGIGMPGPPILLYFAGIGTEKQQLRATTLLFYLYIYSVSLLIQVIFAGTSKVVWQSSGFALPIVWLGLFLGQRLFERIPQKGFRIFIYIILSATGMILLISAYP